MSRLIVAVTVLIVSLFSQLYAEEPLSVEVSVNGKVFSPFDLIVTSIVVKNASGNDIALENGIISTFYNYNHWARTYVEYEMYDMDTGEKDKWGRGPISLSNLGIDEKKYKSEFFVLPAGKYITISVYGRMAVRIRTRYKVFVKVVHKPPDSVKAEYAEFAEWHNATTFEGEVVAKPVEFIIEGPRSPMEQKMLEMASTGRFGGDPMTNFVKRLRKSTAFSEGHPVWDFWFARRCGLYLGLRFFDEKVNLFWLSSKLVHIRQLCLDFLHKVDDFISRCNSDKKFDRLMEEVLWRKCAVLYALGRDAEADALKDELMSKEPDRVFYFELKRLKETVEHIKRRIESEEEKQEQQGSEVEAETPKETSADSEPHRETDESGTETTSGSHHTSRAACERRLPDTDESRVHKEEVSVASVIGMTDIILFALIILLAAAIVIGFFFLFRRHKV